MTDWKTEWNVFQGTGQPTDRLAGLPPPPPWRRWTTTDENPKKPASPAFSDFESEKDRGKPITVSDEVKRAINAALCLRRPLLVTGKPGVGKSSLASAVAYELQMGPVLTWPITSRTTVKSGLYEYDAVGRLQSDDKTSPIGKFLKLGPLGTALYPTSWPRTLLVDEIDKGDIDLPNDLLNVLEEGRFEIPELARATETVSDVRLHDSDLRVPITKGEVKCKQFPFIIMTSNGEREFPAPFLRRCIRITIPQPTDDELRKIINSHLSAHLDKAALTKIDAIVTRFVSLRSNQDLATDQLLNAVFLLLGGGRNTVLPDDSKEREQLLELLLKQLTGAGAS